MTQTIIGDSLDPFYRYKRPVSIVENKSGCTKVINLDDISRALHTESSYILHYIQLKKSIAAAKNGDIKTIILQNEIEKLLNEFINEYILCKKCGLPELHIEKTKKVLDFICDACGHSEKIPENKFTKIIYKNHK